MPDAGAGAGAGQTRKSTVATAATPPTTKRALDASPSVSAVDALSARALHCESGVFAVGAHVCRAPLICVLSACASEAAPECATKSPTPIPALTTASPPNMIEGTVLRPRRTTGGGACGRSSSGMITTTSDAAVAGAATLPSQTFLPGARAVTTCSPGSTGTATSHSAFPTGAPSRSTSTPGRAATGIGTEIERRASCGARASARLRATPSRSGCFASAEASATETNVAHALASLPTFS